MNDALQHLTIDNIDPLLSYLPMFQNPGFYAGEVVSQEGYLAGLKLRRTLQPATQPTMPGSLPTMQSPLPTMADELAHILQRNKKWVKRSYLSLMIRNGILVYTIPDRPRHPNQAYRAKKQGVMK